MLIIKCTTYNNGKPTFINASEAIFFHDDGRGGTVFVFPTKVSKDTLLNEHVTQKPEEIFRMLENEPFFQCTSFDKEGTKVYVNIGKVAEWRENDKAGTVFIFSMKLEEKLVMNQHVRETPDDIYFMITKAVAEDAIRN